MDSTIKNLLIFVFCVILIAGCNSTTKIIDGEQTTNKSYVFFKVTSNHKMYDQVSSFHMTLTHYDEQGNELDVVPLGATYKNQVQVIELPPGYYGLTQTESRRLGWQETYGSDLIMFNVSAGKINYAGDWKIDAVIKNYVNEQEVGAAAGVWTSKRFRSVNYRLKPKQIISEATIKEFTNSYPKLVTDVPFADTKIAQFVQRYNKVKHYANSIDDNRIYPENEWDSKYKLKVQKTPYYPKEALEQNISGFVEAKAVIDQDGKLVNIRVTESLPKGVFEQSARDSLKQWEYEPAKVGEQPVKAEIILFLEWDVPIEE